MEEIIRIQKPVTFDESIAHSEVHAHQPFASSTFGNNDEIRISVQNQNECVLPEKSSMHIHGKVTKEDYSRVAATKLVNMAVCHMFEKIRYELNGVEIDRNKNVGITSIMKGYLSLTPGQQRGLENTGWLSVADINLADDAGNFDVVIPLRYLLGFAEDYCRVVVNAKHELILTRANTDLIAVLQTNTTEKFKITLKKVEWLLPYIKLADKPKIQLLNYIAKDSAIPMSFRSWETYVYPMLPSTTRHDWAVKTSTQLEKPRYVIMGFQTARKNEALKNASEFDHCRIRDVKLFLNSQCYPYGNLNLDISNNQYAILYDMYVQFQTSYYNKEAEPLLSKNQRIILHLTLHRLSGLTANELTLDPQSYIMNPRVYVLQTKKKRYRRAVLMLTKCRYLGLLATCQAQMRNKKNEIHKCLKLLNIMESAYKILKKSSSTTEIQKWMTFGT
ncbi:uncharacterized protein LOC124414420 [Diprion similis]|uniref:uncharacterized protein LOC124414420 n=1 Tax=Diprion similis TaxID=362088 RepID=UPI001EF9429E|nr:uncharacterized protein LOC124414420 [Diprion similis]